ncbi:hypothetical protein V6N13_004318 [Hibiscus sabdariffa]|uniref:Uncharacterized protein n=1 Tax=Hibiscus sabdariffa TaxID=183260 RepID=A0ABR2RYU6_9ROSI
MAPEPPRCCAGYVFVSHHSNGTWSMHAVGCFPKMHMQQALIGITSALFSQRVELTYMDKEHEVTNPSIAQGTELSYHETEKNIEYQHEHQYTARYTNCT